MSQCAGQDSCRRPARLIVAGQLDYAKPARQDTDLAYISEPQAFVAFRRPDHLDEVKQVFHIFTGISLSNGFDTTTLRGYESHFASNLEQAERVLDDVRKKLELAQQKANATPQETILIEIAVLSSAYLAGTANRTQKDNLRKGLSEGFRIWPDLTPSQQLTLRKHAQALEGAEDKALMKAVKKILNESTL